MEDRCRCDAHGLLTNRCRRRAIQWPRRSADAIFCVVASRRPRRPCGRRGRSPTRLSCRLVRAAGIVERPARHESLSATAMAAAIRYLILASANVLSAPPASAPVPAVPCTGWMSNPPGGCAPASLRPVWRSGRSSAGSALTSAPPAPSPSWHDLVALPRRLSTLPVVQAVVRVSRPVRRVPSVLPETISCASGRGAAAREPVTRRSP